MDLRIIGGGTKIGFAKPDEEEDDDVSGGGGGAAMGIAGVVLIDNYGAE
jgi:hypothetical protein